MCNVEWNDNHKSWVCGHCGYFCDDFEVKEGYCVQCGEEFELVIKLVVVDRGQLTFEFVYENNG